MSDEKDELLMERNELELRALDWADRWIAANPEYDPEFVLRMVRPISFSRTEVEATQGGLKTALRPPPATMELL